MTKTNDQENLIEGHEYDGIRELDNKLPPWWLYLFYFTIFWAVAYMLYFHVLNIGDSSYEEYMKEVDPQWTEVRASAPLQIGYASPFYSPEADLTPLRREQIKLEQAEADAISAADARAEQKISVGDMTFDQLIISAMRVATDDNRETLSKAFPDLYAQYQTQLTGTEQKPSAPPPVSEPEKPVEPYIDETNLAAGKTIFQTNCATCHGKLGEGGIGPNLTDDFYLHGAGMTNTVRVIVQGVAAKGMISWRGILKEDQIKQVSSYIISLHGTNPPNAKSPQGEKIVAAINE